MASEIVQYKADNGQDITVTEQDVRDLMAANGNAMDNVTSQEVKMFLRLCQSQRLNPFTRDAYIVKYGNQPATVIAGKDAFVKRATRNKRYRGHEAGITVVRKFKKDGGVQTVIERREGSMVLPGEELVGGWAKVYLEGYECPIYEEVALSEYYAPDKYGKNGWAKMPATMIRKVALCHALREAFPEDLGGLYGAEEMDQAAPQSYEPPVVESVETVRQAPAAETVQAPPAPPAPIDAYKLALIRARDERGVPVADAMAKVREIISKPPEAYDEADIAAAVTIVDGLGQPEPGYEVVEEQLPLSDDDIPF
ncbi:phage recombination protein Bet [Adlercreutzia equolifaciens]|uniref:phage recombination protein Bet n=1 Tax=Adlercreutzia equolifaciens TaxID=446660 RepID=UPI0035230847